MNTENKIGLMSVDDLRGMKFFIPNYQRGYRWDSLQVVELLDDLFSFSGQKGYYCLQPLAVRKRVNDVDGLVSGTREILDSPGDDVIDRINRLMSDSVKWEVIDGQQRLTTIFIVLKVINAALSQYSIEYETRPATDDNEGSASFLDNILSRDKAAADRNIDYYHMWSARVTSEKWLSDREKECPDIRNLMLDTILHRVKFIWYESVSENPIEVFTRLNIGKIALTNAELIKAIILNKSNFRENPEEDVEKTQLEISEKWDEIESALHNEELWLFLNDPQDDRPTRIDFIFELLKSTDRYGLKALLGNEKYGLEIGDDRYSVYRYFAAAMKYSHQEKTSLPDRMKAIWNDVTSVFDTFLEWFNDEKYYHYIGFLLWDCEESKLDKFPLVRELYDEWSGNVKDTKVHDKDTFLDFLKGKIRDKVINLGEKDLDSLLFGEHKGKIKRVLLLHNICTTIDQQQVQEDKYRLHVFYKFPFHLFKQETWNVEHVDSATTNELKRPKERRAWARAALCALGPGCREEMSERLKAVVRGKCDDETFVPLFGEVEKLLPENDRLVAPENSMGDDNERMHLWNLALLDEGTNKAYHNSIFSVKRSFIINKEYGRHCSLDDDGNVKEDDGKAIAFVPVCTKQVFMKYYTKGANGLLCWGRADAASYLKDIKDKLKPFLK